MRHAQQLADRRRIAVSLAHEINNPLDRSTNNSNCSRRASRPISRPEKVVENERLRLDSYLARARAGIVRRLDEMTRKGEYETRRTTSRGKRMADLAPRDDGKYGSPA